MAPLRMRCTATRDRAKKVSCSLAIRQLPAFRPSTRTSTVWSEKHRVFSDSGSTVGSNSGSIRSCTSESPSDSARVPSARSLPVIFSCTGRPTQSARAKISWATGLLVSVSSEQYTVWRRPSLSLSFNLPTANLSPILSVMIESKVILPPSAPLTVQESSGIDRIRNRLLSLTYTSKVPAPANGLQPTPHTQAKVVDCPGTSSAGTAVSQAMTSVPTVARTISAGKGRPKGIGYARDGPVGLPP